MRIIMQSSVKEPLNEVHNVLEEDSTDTKFVTVSIQFEAKPTCMIMFNIELLSIIYSGTRCSSP